MRCTTLSVLPLTTLLAAASGGCQRNEPASVAAIQPQPAATSAASSPVNERDRERQAEFKLATEGLHFESGVVEVDPFGEPDLERAQTHLAAGDEFMARNQHTLAIGAYGSAARSAPSLAIPYERMGAALIYKAKYPEAIASYRTALRQDPASLQYRFDLARTLEMSGDRPAARAALEELVGLDPKHGPAHSRLAIGAYYAGEYARAWDHVHAARAAGKEPPPQFIELLEEAAPSAP